jgi:hypothetical protein
MPDDDVKPTEKVESSAPDSKTVAMYLLNILGKLLLRWFRYGSGTAPLPTQPPIIEKLRDNRIDARTIPRKTGAAGATP